MTIGRALTRIEATLLNLDRIACVNFLIIARVRGGLPADRLREALRAIQRKHYNLNVSVKLGSDPSFVFSDDLVIPLRVIADGDEETWRVLAEQELSQCFDFEKGPFARAILITTATFCDLMVCFDHLYADGMSGMHFVKDVLAYCGESTAGARDPSETCRSQIYLDRRNFPRSALGLRGTLRKLEFLGRMVYERLFTPSGRLPSPSYLPIPDRKSVVIHRELNKEDSARLVRRCEEERTTVQGALCSALAHAFGEHLMAAEHVPAPLLNCISVVNLRKYFRTPPADSDLGLYVGQLSYRVNAGNANQMWPTARSIIRKLRRDLEGGLPFAIYDLLFSKTFNTPEEFMAVFEAKDPYVEVSNLGKLEVPGRYGELHLEKIHFASSQHFFQATGWGINLFVVTFNGRLFGNFQLAAKDWSREKAERIVDRAIGLLF